MKIDYVMTLELIMLKIVMNVNIGVDMVILYGKISVVIQFHFLMKNFLMNLVMIIKNI